MSEQKTWLGKVIAELLSVFKSNWIGFAIKIANKVPEEIKEKLDFVIRIVEKIKNGIDSPEADLILASIPGEYDDNLRDAASKILDVIIKKYNVINQGKLNPEAKHIIATNLTQELTGLSFGQSAFTIEAAYQKYKSQNT